MAASHNIVSDPFTIKLISIKAGRLCRRCDFSHSDYDDICQSMRLYLLKKARLFNPVRGNLEAFVTNALNTWVKLELRFREREMRRDQHKAVSLERTQVGCDDDTLTLGAALLEDDGHRLTQAYPRSSVEQFEMSEAVQHAMQNVPPDDRAILKHAAEHGVASAARTFDCSRRQILNSLARSRIHFEKAGLGSN